MRNTTLDSLNPVWINTVDESTLRTLLNAYRALSVDEGVPLSLMLDLVKIQQTSNLIETINESTRIHIFCAKEITNELNEIAYWITNLNSTLQSIQSTMYTK